MVKRADADADADEVRALYAAAGAFRPQESPVQQAALVAADVGDPAGAAAHFSALSQARPDDACALSNLGSQLLELGPVRLDEATAALRRATDLAPRWAHPHYGLGIALQRTQDEAGAAQAYGKALSLDPEHAGALASLLTMSRLFCQWDYLGALEERARRFLVGPDREPPAVLTPLASLLMPTTPHEQYEAARRWSRTVQAQSPNQSPAIPPRAASRCRSARGRRLRLGYLSADLFPGTHPVARQMVDVLERHARPGARVHVTVYNLSWAQPDDDLDVGARIRSTAQEVVDVAGMPASEAARRIADDGTDVLVDLQGFTHGCRPEVLALHPAPVQVNFLGYPGTLGSPVWDYALADRYLVPPSQARHWGERLCYLPDCYMPSDTRREAGGGRRERAEWGLPAHGRGTVFCCMSHNVKINPSVWDVWMRVLRAVPRSVLWLFAGHPCVPAHLQAEAERRGVDPARLVFAPRLKHAAYLAAMRQADLFLDTWPYGAGATANDALFAGLPVLTLAGPTYVGRMAASQCRAIGLPDMVARSPTQYERWAIEIARMAHTRRELRRRLQRNRDHWPLFDMERYTSALEDAYGRMATTSRAA